MICFCSVMMCFCSAMICFCSELQTRVREHIFYYDGDIRDHTRKVGGWRGSRLVWQR